jgi:hypothetical protein
VFLLILNKLRIYTIVCRWLLPYTLHSGRQLYLYVIGLQTIASDFYLMGDGVRCGDGGIFLTPPIFLGRGTVTNFCLDTPEKIG